VYYLAAMESMAKFAKAFLRLADHYLAAACGLPDLPRTIGEDTDSHAQLRLFVHQAGKLVPAEPFAYVAIRDAVDEVAELFRAVSIPSLSDLDVFMEILERRLKRLEPDGTGGTQEPPVVRVISALFRRYPRRELDVDEAAHELLSAGEELRARLERHALVRAGQTRFEAEFWAGELTHTGADGTSATVWRGTGARLAIQFTDGMRWQRQLNGS
jgi:hypothetical protein